MPDDHNHTPDQADAQNRHQHTAKALGFIQAAIRLGSDARRMLEGTLPREEMASLELALSELVKARHYAGRRVK